MIGYKYFMGFAIFSFVMSVTLIAEAVALMISGHHDSQFVTMSLPWNALGILSSWIATSVKFQADRLTKLEAELKDRAKI